MTRGSVATPTTAMGTRSVRSRTIYYDDLTSRPEWVAVRTGLFGKKVTFAPIVGSSARAEDLELAYDKDLVKDAPNCEADGHLSEDEERRLFEHYQFSWDDTATSGYGDVARADTGYVSALER